MVAANAIHAAHDNPDAIDPVIGLKEQREGARHGG
jgi:hypothetical protein